MNMTDVDRMRFDLMEKLLLGQQEVFNNITSCIKSHNEALESINQSVKLLSDLRDRGEEYIRKVVRDEMARYELEAEEVRQNVLDDFDAAEPEEPNHD